MLAGLELHHIYATPFSHFFSDLLHAKTQPVEDAQGVREAWVVRRARLSDDHKVCNSEAVQQCPIADLFHVAKVSGVLLSCQMTQVDGVRSWKMEGGVSQQNLETTHLWRHVLHVVDVPPEAGSVVRSDQSQVQHTLLLVIVGQNLGVGVAMGWS